MKKVEYFDLAFIPAMHFGFTNSRAAYAREMKRLNVEDPPDYVLPNAAATTHFFTRDAAVTAIVCLDSKKAKGYALCQVASICAHEAVHVWQECLKQMRETEPGAEVEAYAIQFFTQRMLEHLKLK